MAKRLQNRIAQSRWALTTTAVFALFMCFLQGMMTNGQWLQMAMLLAGTLLMVELNNANALIRIYSRMVSCAFLVMMVMSPFILHSTATLLLQLSFIASLLLIFHAYQDPKATGWVFYAFLAMGIGSIVFPQVLLLVPVLWLLLLFNILAFNLRTFFASILGLAAPYWFYGAWLIYKDQADTLVQHFTDIIAFGPVFDFSQVGIDRLAVFIFTVVVAFIGSVHFLALSYKDKIRTRMLYEGFILLDGAIVLYIMLQPQLIDRLLALSIVTTAPLIGHYIALTQSRFSNVVFILLAVVALALCMLSLWTPSMPF